MKRLGKIAKQTLLIGRAFLVPSTPKMIDGFLHMRKGSETKKNEVNHDKWSGSRIEIM